MKRYLSIFVTIFAVLGFSGCEETRPGVIDGLIFGGSDQWLERNTATDPFELVDGECCNDYRPFPLPIDTSITAVIDPIGDLDYFNLRITDALAGRLTLSRNEGVAVRIFSRGLAREYEPLMLTSDGPEAGMAAPERWTVLYGPSDAFSVQVARGKGAYTLSWKRVVPTTTLIVEQPQAGDQWGRSNFHRIRWSQSQMGYKPVTVVLLKGAFMVEVLRQNITWANELLWVPDDNLEEGVDYRILVYLTSDPDVMDISNAFEIY